MYKHHRVSEVIKYYFKKLNDLDNNSALLCRVKYCVNRLQKKKKNDKYKLLILDFRIYFKFY